MKADTFVDWFEGHERVPIVAPGEMIDGCEIKSLLGKGGNGGVYLAVNHESEQRMAIKVLLRSDETTECRFEDEIEILSKYGCTWMPKFYGSGEYNGYKYFKMEELSPIILPHKDRDVAKFVVKVAEMVGELHKLGYVHRDIKPENIMKRSNGELVLIDFGLIKNPDASRSISVVNGARQVCGTPGYAPPEQWSGSKIGPSTDIYPLGVLIKACFNKKMPAKWRLIYDRATCEDPALRFATVEELIDAIKKRNKLNDPFGGGNETVTATRERKIKWWFTGFKVAATVVSIIAGAVSLYMSLRPGTKGKNDSNKPQYEIVKKVEENFVFIKKGGRNLGSGIVVNEGGKRWVYTNKHVVAKPNGENDFENVSASLCNGQNVALGEIEWGANGEELVRYPVDGKYRGVPVADMPPNYEEAIFVFGDGGATEILSCGCGKVSGRVLGGGGIGYSVDPVSGNSGGAVVAGIVVNEKGKLIGLNKPATQGDFSGPSNCAVLVVGSVKWTSKTKEKERKKREFTTAKENAGKCPKNADALYEYGRMLLKGEGTEPNPVEAVGKLKESAKLGNAAAMFLLGMCYSKGDGIEKNEKEAVRWLEKAREKGNTSASSELFKMHNDGSELFKMHNDGKVYLRDVEELVARQELVRNDAKVDMNYELGRYYSHDGPERDLAKSAENMKDAAERGNVEAKWHYGCMLIHGKGVPKNEEKGVKYLEEAAAENCPEAKVHLSACLMNGTGCTKDEERANRLIQEAAEKNKYHQAMFMMFEKYRDGSGFAKDADQAFRYLEQSAKAGNPEALRVLGDTYCQKFQDPGVCIKKEEDLKLATNWWYKSAIKGDRRAQYRLGVVLWGGYGPIEMDHEAAKKWLLQAASKDNDMAQYSLGRLMLKECPKEAEHWLNKQAQNGNPKAKKWMSVLLSSRKDKIQARRYAEEAADEFENLINTNEDCEAMYELAGQYSAGLGVGQDRKKAFDLYWRAATNGFALAQFAVGYAYSNGEGVDRSDQKAVEWYKKSIKGGCVMGYTNLAYLYDHGEGVPTNPEDATYYYRKGAEYGDACAQVALGWRLMIGLGGERDTQEGFKWIQRAALQNYASAYFGASLCYYAGVGVEKNKAESGKWLGKVKMYGGGNETRKNIKVAIDALKQLAVEGDAWAMYLLGVSHDLGFVEYASGNGISKDEKTARIWYRRSAEKGCAEAKRQLEK